MSSMNNVVAITPSSSSFVKNESTWKLISQGAEARVWKIPITLMVEEPNDCNNEQQQQEEDGASSSLDITNGQSPPVKRTRRLEHKNHINEVVTLAEGNDDEANEHCHHHDVPQQLFMVGKERFKKSYRHIQLDERLNKQRCRMEARILEKCYNHSTSLLRVPRVYRLDPPIIFLEYLTGKTVRDALEMDLLPSLILQQQQQEGEQQVVQETSKNNTTNAVLVNLSQRMGRMIRHLHNLGIIHGDLTTSNMMLVPSKTIRKERRDNNDDSNNTKTNTTNNDLDEHEHNDVDELALIDFGLAKNTESAEERAVDLYVLERALISTHPTLPTSFMETLLDAYNNNCSLDGSNVNNVDDDCKNDSSKSSSAATLRRLEQVRQRGRKRECFG